MTYEEFQAGLAETPELIDEIYEKHAEGYTKHLTEGKKMVVTTMDEYAKDRQKAIDDTTKTIHSEWEAKVEKVTGQKRPEGKKGLAWFDELSDKLKYATEDGADPNSAMIKGLKKELEDLKTSLTTKEKEALQARIDGQITSAIKGLAFAIPSHIKKDEDKTAYAQQKAADATDIFNARYAAAVDDQGRFVYTNKKGEAQTLNGEPMTADQIAARDFANELTPKGHKQGGAGSGNDDSRNDSSNPDYLGATTEEIRTKLSELMLKVGTDAWADKYNKAHLAAGFKKVNDVYVKS